MVARAAPICDKMDALSKEIDTMCAKYKAADKSVIKGSHAEKIYDEFFASQESSNDDIRRILRDLRQNGYTNAQVTLGGHIGTLVQAHNKFLKSRQEK
jgi:hypothetical protein